MRNYFCDTCHFIYDETVGDPKNGVPPNTPLELLSGSLCNRCQMNDLDRYQVLFSEYKNLEATYYSAFSGKWHTHCFLNYLNQNFNSSPTILEVGTGLGRATLPLISHGFQVTSIERSLAFMTALKKQKWTQSPLLKLIEGDIFNLSVNKTFDVILLTDATFQELIYQHNEVDSLAMLSNLLSPNGIIWIETMSVSESHQKTRKKSLDSKRELILESQITVSQKYFTYHHLFELFHDGVSLERCHESRTVPNINLLSQQKDLPDTLELIDIIKFPQEGKIKVDQPLDIWTDGGYPLPTSNKLVKKDIIILKNKGDLS